MKRFFRPAAAALALLGASLLLPHELRALSCTWDGSSNNWNTSGSWSCSAVPGPSDSATINSGTVTLEASHSVKDVTLTGGTITGGDLNVSGAFSWTGGTMSGSGTTTIAATSTLTINSGAVGVQRQITNNGTITWVAGQLQMSNGTINNNSTFTAQPDNNIGNFGGTNAFNNNAAGTFTRNTGTGLLDMNIPFTNAGTTTVSTGTLRIQGGGTSTGTIDASSTILTFTNNYSITAGTFTVATLNLQGGTIDMTPTTYTVSTVNLTGSTYNLNKTSNTSNWNHSGGTLAGSGNVTVASGKTYSWTGGTMAGGATTTIASGGTLTINSGAVGVQRQITNNGTITWVAGQLQMSNGTINNNSTFTAQPDNNIGNFGGTNAFNNNAAGTFTRNTGTGLLDMNIPFTNAGTTTVSTGTLRIQGGGTSTGTIDASSTILTFTNNYSITAGTFTVATLNLQGGTIDMTPTTYTVSTVNLTGSTYNLNKTSNTSNWNHSGGTLAGSGNVTVASGKTYSWTGGTMAGGATTTIASGGTLTINSGAVGIQRQITNNGTITWVAGQLQMSNGTINNNSTFTAQPDNNIGNFGGTNAFNNNAAGTFTRNTGTGLLDMNIPFTNAGTTTVSTGTLRIQGGGTSTGTIDASSTILTFTNNYSITAGTFTVATLNLQGGTIDMTPTTYTVSTVNLTGSTYNLNKTSNTSNWNHSGGTLAGSGNVTVASGKTYSWTGGTMAGGATTTIASGGTLTINSGAVGIQRQITNNGTITWVAGQLQMSNGTINNNSTFTAQPDNNIGNFGGTNAFNNNAAGTFTRNTGTGQLDMNTPFVNAGTLTVSTGEMRINGGGSSTGTIDASSTILTFTNNYSITAGTFTVATLNLQGGTIDMTPTTYTVPTVNLTGSTYNLNKTSNASNWNHSGGTLSGSGAVTVASGKTYAWTGGTMAGGATTTIASGGTLTVNSGAVGIQRQITNNGTITWVAGQLQMSNGTINNNSTFTAQPDNNIGNFGGTNAFNNNAAAAFNCNPGAGKTCTVGIPFNNAGAVNALSGALGFTGIFTQTAGTTTLNGGDVGASSGLNIQGGTLKGKGTITGNVFNGGTVAPGLSPGILTIAGNYSQTAAGTLAVEINGLTAGTQYDQLVVNGTVALAGSLAVTSGFTPSAGDGFAIIVNDASEAVTGDFEGLPESAVVTALPAKYRITYLGATGNDVLLEAGPAASAQSILVDATATSGGASDGNGVFEPGETVGIKPSWKNQGTDPISLSGSASDFTGPSGAGVTYTITDDAAVYGSVAVNATADCGSNCYSLFVTDPAARPTTHWDAHFTETPSTLADPPKVWTLHLGDSFTDVPRSQLFYKRIETLVHTGITAGCAVGKYCPGDSVTRDQMAIFLAKGIAGGGPQVPVSGSFNGNPYNCVNGGTSLFADVAPTDIFCKHVHYMAVQNVTLGCSGGNFCPHGAISRSDMAIFVAKAIVAPGGGASVPQTYTDAGTGLSYSCNPASPNLHFTDIGVSDTFCKQVHFLWARGIVSGCTGTTYCPTQGVTRDQMARFLGNAFDLLLYAP